MSHREKPFDERPPAERVRALFLGALRRPVSARAEFLTRHAGDLRAEVEALLAEHDCADGFLATPPLATILDALNAADAPSRAAPRLRPGDRVGDFEITGVVACGARSMVYRATQAPLQRTVALKVVSATSATPGERQRFAREIALAAQVASPHLVTIHAGGEDPAHGVLYCAMQLIDGPDLASLAAELHARGAPDAQARRAIVARCADVAQGLAALHTRGLVHRDVKPANIVLDGRDTERPWSRPAVLVDFGLVRSTASTAALSTEVGTLLYLAPEILQRRTLGAHSDVFALGLVLWDLLSGRDPTQRPIGATPPPLRQAVPGVDRDLDAIVGMATAPLPEWRYADAGLLAADLQAWSEGRPVRARRSSRWSRAWRWVRSHPAATVRGLLVTTCATTMVASTVLGVGYGVSVAREWRRANAAWGSADLAGFVQARAALPALLAARVGPGDLDSATATRNRGLAALLAAIAAHGVQEGLHRAARFVARDGLAVHPVLVTFLARSLDGPDAVGKAALALAARLFLECPVTDTFGMAAAAPLRARLQARLHGSDVPPGSVFTALAGCGDAATVSDLATWPLRCVRMHGSVDPETARLAFLAAAAIVARGDACGFGVDLARAPHAAVLADAGSVLDMLGFAPDEYLHPSGAVVELFNALALLRRRHAMVPAPGDVFTQRGAVPLRARAALAEEAVRDRVRWLRDQTRGYTMAPAAEVGELVGLHGSAELRELGHVAARSHARRQAFPPEVCVQVFEAGFTAGKDRRLGGLGMFDTEPASRLAAEFEPPAAIPVELEPAAPGDRECLAAWDFQPHPATRRGGALAVEALGVDVRADELQPDSRYLCLLSPGRSALGLVFVTDSALSDQASLEIALQKSARGLLAHGGSAKLTILCDGKARAERVVIDAASPQPFVFPLPGLSRSEPHRVQVRLDDASETVVRIYAITVRAH